jgi:hypothetical protein
MRFRNSIIANKAAALMTTAILSVVPGDMPDTQVMTVEPGTPVKW